MGPIRRHPPFDVDHRAAAVPDGVADEIAEHPSQERPIGGRGWQRRRHVDLQRTTRLRRERVVLDEYLVDQLGEQYRLDRGRHLALLDLRDLEEVLDET